MASLRKVPGSQNWIACYTDADGKRRQRSTGTADAKDAQAIADSYEAAYTRRMTETQIRRTFSDISERLNQKSIASLSLREWFTRWLELVKPEVSVATLARYTETTHLVAKMLPALANKPVDQVSDADIFELRGMLATERSAGTANQTLKIVRMSFKRARRLRLIVDNPALDIPRVKPQPGETIDKQPFTLEHLRGLLRCADDEWRGMIYAGLYTAGQRLSDVATMTVRQVDLAHRTVRFDTNKTGRTVIVPIVDAWMKDLRARVKGKAPGEYLFPRAAQRVALSGGRVGRVSNSFRTLLSRIGLACQINKIEGAVHGRRRVMPFSFHSFRHTATSMMKNAGVSDAVARDIVGHESEAVSANYTHIDETTKRAALAQLPTLNLR